MQQLSGNRHLLTQILRKVNSPYRLAKVILLIRVDGKKAAIVQHGKKLVFYSRLRQFQLLCSIGDKVLSFCVNISVVMHAFSSTVIQPALNSLGGILYNAKIESKPVDRLELYPAHIPCAAIGIGLHDVLCCIAIRIENLIRLVLRKAVLAKKDLGKMLFFRNVRPELLQRKLLSSGKAGNLP